jgi:hypothetical protein
METMPDKICIARCRKGYAAFDEVSRTLEADEALYHHDRVVQGLMKPILLTPKPMPDDTVTIYKVDLGEEAVVRMLVPPTNTSYTEDKYHHDRVVQELQTKLDKAIKALEAAEKVLGDGIGHSETYSVVRETLEELK